VKYKSDDDTKVSFNNDARFSDNLSGKCPIKSCSMYEKDCKTAFNSNNIALDKVNPTTMLLTQNILLGYN